jgi:RNA polymerase sigma-70 factor, ECF subfamily
MNKRTDKSINQNNPIVVRQNAPASASSTGKTSPEDLLLVNAILGGDESAFASLVDMYSGALLRLALIYVPKTMLAEEVVQETWIGVLQALPRFERRSSLKTWIFRILANRAKTFALREGRTVPFSSLADDVTIEDDQPAVDAERFFPPGTPRAGSWISLPENWDTLPEQWLLSKETYRHIEIAIAALPPNQRTVILLHDVEGWTAEEIRSVLDVSEANQRVLLHRARSKVRQALEYYFNEKEGV